MQATVQMSLDVLSIDEAVSTAAIPLRAGVDWLEAGTPLIIAEGMHVNVDTQPLTLPSVLRKSSRQLSLRHRREA